MARLLEPRSEDGLFHSLLNCTPNASALSVDLLMKRPGASEQSQAFVEPHLPCSAPRTPEDQGLDTSISEEQVHGR